MIGDLCELVEDDEAADFGQSWIDQLAAEADRELSNQELEAIDRLRGELRPDRDTSLAGYLAGRDQRPSAGHLRDGIHALAWLRAHA